MIAGEEVERFEGIVLFSRAYKENDSLVKIFTKNQGKKMFFVKGGRKATNKLFANLQPLSHHQYIGKQHIEGFSFLSEAETLHLFPNLQQDIYLQATATYFAQLVDMGLEDHRPSESLYLFLLEALKKLDQGFPGQTLRLYFDIHMLNYFGLKIDWENCLLCHKQVTKGRVSIVNQGLLCQTHEGQDRFSIGLDSKKIKIISLLVQVPITQLNSLKLSSQTITELRDIVEMFYHEYVGINLKSKKFLLQLEEYEKQFEI